MTQLRKIDPPLPPERKLVLFTVGNVVYGFPIEKVREVVAAQPVIELPHAPPAIVGVTDHRGEVVPVVDLRSRFGLAPLGTKEPRRRVKWVMVDVARDGEPSALIAAVVDSVLNVFQTREPLRPAPTLGGGEDARGILGVLPRPTATTSSRTAAATGEPRPRSTWRLTASERRNATGPRPSMPAYLAAAEGLEEETGAFGGELRRGSTSTSAEPARSALIFLLDLDRLRTLREGVEGAL